MRHALFAPAALAMAALVMAAPAAAQTSFPPEMDAEIARSLPHPYDIEDAGATVGRALGAILDVPVGGVIQAIDPAARVDAGETLGEVASRDDPYFEGRIDDQLRGLTLDMADLMRQVAVVAPVLRRSLADLERNIAGAMSGQGSEEGDYDLYSEE